MARLFTLQNGFLNVRGKFVQCMQTTVQNKYCGYANKQFSFKHVLHSQAISFDLFLQQLRKFLLNNMFAKRGKIIEK